MIDDRVAGGNGLENRGLVLYLPQESRNRDLYSSCSDKRPSEPSGRAVQPGGMLSPAVCRAAWMVHVVTTNPDSTRGQAIPCVHPLLYDIRSESGVFGQVQISPY